MAVDPIIFPAALAIYLLTRKKKDAPTEEEQIIEDQSGTVTPFPISPKPPAAQQPSIVPVYIPQRTTEIRVVPVPSPYPTPTPAPPPPTPTPTPSPTPVPPPPVLTPPSGPITIRQPAVGSYDWGTVRRAQAWTNQGAKFAAHEQVYTLTRYNHAPVIVIFPNASWVVSAAPGWSASLKQNYNQGEASHLSGMGGSFLNLSDLM